MGTIDRSTKALLHRHHGELPSRRLPLAMGGMMHGNYGNMQNMGTYGVQMKGMMQWGNQMMGNQMMGNQMMGNQMQQQGMNAGNWWGMTSDEDKEAYLKWCEERKL